MVQLQADLEKLKKANIHVVGVSYDSVDVLKKFSDKQKIKFPLLSDAASKTIKAYDLHFKRGLPHPGTILIDKQGKVRAKLFNDGYAKRHKPEALIEAVNSLDAGGERN